MRTRIDLAWRNLWRNSRRTLVNLSMIISGFTAIVVFEGFGQYLLRDLRSVFISIQYGHLQIGTKSSWDLKTVDDPNDRLIDQPKIVAEGLSKIFPEQYATGRLGFYAMLSTSTDSVSARAVSYVPSVEVGFKKNIKIVDGQFLNHDDGYEILLGLGLAKTLGVQPGDSLTVLAQTVDKAINALDMNVVGIVATGLSDSDNVTFYLPLKTAQTLLNTDRIERLFYFLPSPYEYPDKEVERINKILPPDLEAKSWTVLATLYKEMESYYATQNAVISTIILILVLLSISNTVSSSIIERTGEIGTVRAMGDKRRDVLFQFLTEGLLLSLFSGLIAIFVSVAISIFITNLNISLPLPGASIPIFIGIKILPYAYLRAFVLTSCTALAATLYPAWKGSRTPIVDALKQNI